MFSKKKNTTIKVIDPGEADNRRQAYRYIFSQQTAPEITFKQRSVPLMNISAGGLAFKATGFAVNDGDEAVLDLTVPGSGKHFNIHVRLHIFEIKAPDICHCCFENLDPDQEELIHRYVLEMQKQDLGKPI